jgi:hypothetical protein
MAVAGLEMVLSVQREKRGDGHRETLETRAFLAALRGEYSPGMMWPEEPPPPRRGLIRQAQIPTLRTAVIKPAENGASPVRWGILGTGGMARIFTEDLIRLDGHVVTAVGSRSEAGARTRVTSPPRGSVFWPAGRS